MLMPKIPILGFALLGLLHQRNQSGYELRKVFTATAMGNYSDSPGAIYPALRRLEAAGLIAGTDESTPGGRGRRIFRLTDAGTAALRQWLMEPVTVEQVKHDAAELMLRFAFLEEVMGTEACPAFLQSFREKLVPYIAELQEFLAANGPKMPLSARLALEQGIRGYGSMYDWTYYALQQYEAAHPSDVPSTHSASKGGPA